MDLVAFLQRPDIASLSDEEAAQAASTPIITLIQSPKSMIRFRTLASMFGPSEGAVIQAKMEGARDLYSAGTDEQKVLGRILANAISWMNEQEDSAGVDVADPAVRPLIQQFVPSIISQEQADAILARGAVTTYPVSAGVTAEQVAEERAKIAHSSAINARNNQVDAAYNAARLVVSAYVNSTELPTKQQIVDAFAAQIAE